MPRRVLPLLSLGVLVFVSNVFGAPPTPATSTTTTGSRCRYGDSPVRVVPEGHRYSGTRINTTPGWAYDEEHTFSLEEFLTDAAGTGRARTCDEL